MVAKLTRTNLMVNSEKLRELARLKQTSESEAVRDAVEYSLRAEERSRSTERAIAALEAIQVRGGLNDPFGRISG